MCADYKTVPCELQFDEAAPRPDRKSGLVRTHRALEHGFFRNPSSDGDLLWKFGLSWWGEVNPMLDDDGRLSPRSADRLLATLKEHEDIFESEMTELPANEQERFRRRYRLLRNFLDSAIEANAPIDTVL